MGFCLGLVDDNNLLEWEVMIIGWVAFCDFDEDRIGIAFLSTWFEHGD